MDEGKCAREYFCLEKDCEGIRQDEEQERCRKSTEEKNVKKGEKIFN